jgi:spore germination cell wall hydrolase CwlJ-like protein
MTDIAIERGMDTVEIPRSILMCFTVAMMLLGLVASIKLLNWAVDAKLSHVTTTSQITAEFRDRQLDCLAKNIYYEAGSEPFEGKVAVAQVTLNRANSGRFPGDICKVIYQKNVFYEKVVCQFSWYCDRVNNTKAINPANYNESMVAAKRVLMEDYRLPSLKNALYYHASYINPGWNKKKITQIGNHIFYE